MFHRGEGRSWTAEEIGERLKLAFAASLGAGRALYVFGSAADPAQFLHFGTQEPMRAGDYITMMQAMLGRGEDCEMLFAWARAMAGIGPSVAETCRLRGWSEDTVSRRRKAACERLAVILNAATVALLHIDTADEGT